MLESGASGGERAEGEATSGDRKLYTRQAAWSHAARRTAHLRSCEGMCRNSRPPSCSCAMARYRCQGESTHSRLKPRRSDLSSVRLGNRRAAITQLPYSTAAGSWMGSLTTKRVLPGCEVRAIVPPCFWAMMLWLMFSPKPVPAPGDLVVKNGSKTLG